MESIKGLEDLNLRRFKINSDIFSYAFAAFLDNEKMKEDYHEAKKRIYWESLEDVHEHSPEIQKIKSEETVQKENVDELDDLQKYEAPVSDSNSESRSE